MHVEHNSRELHKAREYRNPQGLLQLPTSQRADTNMHAHSSLTNLRGVEFGVVLVVEHHAVRRPGRERDGCRGHRLGLGEPGQMIPALRLHGRNSLLRGRLDPWSVVALDAGMVLTLRNKRNRLRTASTNASPQ